MIADDTAAAGGSWTLSFVITGAPGASNLDAQSFDVPFYDFQYTLNGSVVARVPASMLRLAR